ncbi:hypothetical protein [Streptomyces sp. AP-93]|uniref:hypothetical protein n=1 Tax=Streptomyces sp. AP-93 TaxID=2929048 RepID=UPI001FAF779C|nr:hypothetical protein [Streptomyces sp. AP-93]MCJ0872661.1 hypothetical protein [Streptomyces sp. AP-93]
MDRTRRIVNRLVLLATGALLLTTALPLLVRNTVIGDRLPTWWTALSGRGRWVAPQAWEAWTGRPAAGAAVTAVVILLALTAGGLLLLQGPRGTVRRLPLASPGTVLEARAFTAAVSSRLRALPGVHSVRTGLRGTADRARLRIRVVLDDTASPREILTVLSTDVLPESRVFLAPHPLAAEVRFITRPGGRRVR